MLIFTYLFIFPFTVLGGIQAFVNVTLTSMLSSLFQKNILLERLRGIKSRSFPPSWKIGGFSVGPLTGEAEKVVCERLQTSSCQATSRWKN